MWNSLFVFQVRHFPCPAFSSSVFSVPHFPALHFPPRIFGPAFFPVLHFGPLNLTSLVPHFPVLHFLVPHFQRPRRRSNTRSRRSNALEAAQDTRPSLTNDLTVRPIRHTVQAFWNTLEYSRAPSEPADELLQAVRSGMMLNHVQQDAELKRLSDPPPASPGHDGPATAIRQRTEARADDLQRIIQKRSLFVDLFILTFRLTTRALFKEDRHRHA